MISLKEATIWIVLMSGAAGLLGFGIGIPRNTAAQPPAEQLPPIKDPPDAGQLSWPQVDFNNPLSVSAFIEARRTGRLSINGKDPEPPVKTRAGWIAPGQIAVDDRGVHYLRVLSDKWVNVLEQPNPDAKMPDDPGWNWWLNLDTFRIVRIKAETGLTPVASASLTLKDR